MIKQQKNKEINDGISKIKEEIDRIKVLAGIKEAIPHPNDRVPGIMMTIQSTDTGRADALFNYFSQFDGSEAEEGSPVIMFYPTNKASYDKTVQEIKKYEPEVKAETVENKYNK